MSYRLLPVAFALLPFFSGIAAAEPRVVAGGGDERVLWRFQTQDSASLQFLARAPDGTIYTADGFGTYALSPAGDLLWVSRAAHADSYGGRPISLGADGTIYTGVDFVGNEYAAVVALNPDGTVRWRFFPGVPGDLIIGPNVGPDGNIYGVQEPTFGGIGAFSLDPQGNLIWSDVGDPPLGTADLITTSNIVFGADRLHFGLVRLRSGGNPVIYTYSLDGEQLWTSERFDVHTTSFPMVDPFDRVIAPWGQTGMRAITPDGEEQWFTLHPNGASLVRRPAISSAGIIYSGDFIGVELWALEPDGTTRFVQPRFDLDSLGGITISPDDSLLVTVGGQDDGISGYIRGHAAADGTQRWEVDLGPENGMPQLVSAFDTIYSADSSVVYVTTQFAGDVNDYGYVYAIDTRGVSGGPAVLERVIAPAGRITAGALTSLTASDDNYLFVRAESDPRFPDLRRMQLVVDAETVLPAPATIALRIESHVIRSRGNSFVSLYDWAAGRFVRVGQYALDRFDAVNTIEAIDAGPYVNASGEIRLSIDHALRVPPGGAPADSFFDEIAIDVR
jgi:hypothetical protein